VNLEGVTCGRVCSALTDFGTSGKGISQPEVFHIDARGPKGNEAYRAAHTGSVDSSLWPQIPLCDQEFQLEVRKLCMANENLEGVTVAIFVTDGFEQIRLTEPKMAFDEGAETHAVSPKSAPAR
jgi:deoxyxylulose-5-phosphate synthase